MAPSRFASAYTGLTGDTTNIAVLAAWFLAAGIGIGCIETAEHAAVATNAALETRGSAFGLLAATQSAGNLAASAIAGIIWTTASPSWAFTYLATWMATAITLLATTSARQPTPRIAPPLCGFDGDTGHDGVPGFESLADRKNSIGRHSRVTVSSTNQHTSVKFRYPPDSSYPVPA